MSHTPHELHAEFPEHEARIHELKESDAHFAKLMDEYHEVNRAVHRAETNVEPMDQFAEENLRKRRVSLKDELYRMLTAGAAT
ncbi:YdcH family protein [Ovoidimarina sediminis]|uniref:YdcH family protein n=1 Tax=Ovoidimarina sediminis TaxID=3079856 RepID=UPI00290EE360|nr:YdcH family protein [Rhodophyticola sp. MJ-SS7]MDU8946729.1 YdcH family protein [Rhodophyticola sp. MJ-SS7]